MTGQWHTHYSWLLHTTAKPLPPSWPAAATQSLCVGLPDPSFLSPASLCAPHPTWQVLLLGSVLKSPQITAAAPPLKPPGPPSAAAAAICCTCCKSSWACGACAADWQARSHMGASALCPGSPEPKFNSKVPGAAFNQTHHLHDPTI